MARASKNQTHSLVLSELPERVELRTLRASLEERRDQIAELDLEIETLRDGLADFESHYHSRLAAEHAQLRRVEGITRHLERWAALLRRPPEDMGQRARRIEERRRQQAAPLNRRLESRADDEPVDKTPGAGDPAPDAPPAPSPDQTERLKEAYRALARRFHPDLARTEEERLRFSEIMTRLNTLYREGDLERLRALAEQAKGGEIEDEDAPVEEQIELLNERLTWFDAVLENLREERSELECSSTCQLMRNVEQAGRTGRDLIGELREELQTRVERAYNDVRLAIQDVERDVSDYNRQRAGGGRLPTRRRRGELERVFDPYADKHLVRVGLDELAHKRVSPEAQQLADWIESRAAEAPHLCSLLLLTHVSELSPFPLPGLQRYEDLILRFEHLAPESSLERTLVEAEDLVEYGIKQATEQVAHMGLRFRQSAARDAVALSLPRYPVRRQLKEVLSVLGEVSTCPACEQDIFVMPLYRLRGIDHLRANVCSACGHTLASYWMPKGSDVQAVLNETFIDCELISEWSFLLDRSSVAIQLVPVQVDTWSVGDLKKQLIQEVFLRNDVAIQRRQVRLHQGQRRVAERTPLASLDEQQFVVRLDPGAEMSEREALELIRHRIRNRFR